MALSALPPELRLRIYDYLPDIADRSRHWDASQPTRWQGHVGFYVRLEKGSNEWRCTTGTYPVARDMRGMRLESVELLRYVVRQNVLSRASQRENQALNASDIELIVSAMMIVANHPISAFDGEQSEAGKMKRRETWVDMEEKLLGLHANDQSEQDEPKRFFTPY
ncbi:hypothetical protein D0865_15239 [Hortaea werneckii]|uniref:Uncharacterized protein n=1 Tax=Hortaea werneckii TaxID=91943 RepID=A0A3M7ASJ5_HORWE|nr:hypothetical protein D0865_15239 [Hortaea werneckii]